MTDVFFTARDGGRDSSEKPRRTGEKLLRTGEKSLHTNESELRTDGGHLRTDGGEQSAEDSHESTEPHGEEVLDDGDEGEDEPAILEYWDTAEAVGEPDLVFGTHGDELVFIPQTVLGWTAVEENVEEPGTVRLDGMSDGMREMVVDKLEAVDVVQRGEDLAELTQLSDEEAQVLLLFEGFELSETVVAERLNLAEDRVGEILDDIYDLYDVDTVVEDVREQSVLNEQEARVLVLGEGYGMSVAEIAAELDISADEVRETRRIIREEYDIDVDLSDQQRS